jgi:hypothetical protein
MKRRKSGKSMLGIMPPAAGELGTGGGLCNCRQQRGRHLARVEIGRAHV